jgi:hypothetical protein
MIHAKYYKACEHCHKNYLQQRKGTKYCKDCRNLIRNHGFPRPQTEPIPIRRWKRKEPGSPVQRVLAQLAAREE